MAAEWSPALFLFGVGNEKSTGCILGKSCGHTLYWDLGARYDTGDISNISVKLTGHENLLYPFNITIRSGLNVSALRPKNSIYSDSS
jgi:hypothetical protein